jgi:hypothetical protein
MGLVSSLFVNLTLKHESFIANIRESQEHAEKFRESIDHNVKRATAVLETFFVLAAAEKLKEGLDRALEYGAGLNALADKAGVSTVAFQAFRFAAGEAGVSTEAFQVGMQKLTRTLGDAKAGSDKALTAFDLIGVSQKEIKNLTPEEALKRTAEALGKIEDPARRAHIEVALFGKSGQEMDPLLRQGAAGVEEAQKRVKELGLTLSEGQADKLHELSNEGKALGESFDASLSKIFADDADGLLELAKAAEKVIVSFSKLGEFMRGGVLTRERDGVIAALKLGFSPSEQTELGTREGAIARDAARIAERQKDVAYAQRNGLTDLPYGKRAAGDLEAARGYLGTDLDSALKDTGGFLLKKKDAEASDGLKDATDKASAFDAAIKGLTKSGDELVARLAAIKANLPTEEIALLIKRAADYAAIAAQGDKITSAQATTLKAAADRNYGLGEAIRTASREQEILNWHAESFAEIARRLDTDSDKYTKQVLASATKLSGDAALQEIDRGITSLHAFHDLAIQTGRQFFGDISGGIAAVITGAAKLGDVLVQSFERAAAALIASKIFDLFGGISLGGGQTIGTFLNFGGARAGGGGVDSGRTYLVGEKGPELFTAPGDGHIVPNDALRGMGGGPSAISVHVTTEPSPLFVQVVSTAVAQGNAAMADAARKAQRPGIARGRG